MKAKGVEVAGRPLKRPRRLKASRRFRGCGALPPFRRRPATSVRRPVRTPQCGRGVSRDPRPAERRGPSSKPPSLRPGREGERDGEPPSTVVSWRRSGFLSPRPMAPVSLHSPWAQSSGRFVRGRLPAMQDLQRQATGHAGLTTK